MRVLGWLGALLIAAALLAGCRADVARSDSPATPTASTSPTPAPPSARPSEPARQPSYGSEGFTVRYLDADGKMQTLQPKDFPR